MSVDAKDLAAGIEVLCKLGRRADAIDRLLVALEASEADGDNSNEWPVVMDTKMAAAYLSLQPATLEDKRVRGGGPLFSKLGSSVRYRREDLNAWVAENGGLTSTSAQRKAS